MDMVKIKYWLQDTIESGRWITTLPITRKLAENIINNQRNGNGPTVFDRGEIVEIDSD